MSGLSVGDGSNQVTIADIAIVAGKQQVTLGNLERDLVLLTKGNLQVQIGSKFYKIPLSSVTSNDTIGDINAPVIVLNTGNQLSTTTYIGDGYLYYVKDTSSFYIAIGGTYLLVAEGVKPVGGGGSDNTGTGATDKIYLSFVTPQTLTGEQKNQVLSNSGYLLGSLSELSSYTLSDVYTGQIIYSIANKRHYYLNDSSNLSQANSWKELYLNLVSGGVVNSTVTIDINGVSEQSKSALHIPGSYTANRITTLPTINSNIFVLGGLDYSTGLAVFNYQDNTYFQSLKPGKGFQFITTSNGDVGRSPLNINNNSVGIGGATSSNYTLNIAGNSQQSGFAYLNSGLGNDTFVSGLNGSGYNLSLDINTNKWILEIDKVISREEDKRKSGFNSKSIDGSYWSNPAVKVTSVQNIDYIDVYVKASKIGNYKSDHTLIPLSEKLTYAMCDAPTDETDSGSDRLTRIINLPYGIGHMDSSSVDLSYDTYIKEDDGVTYSAVPGEYSLVSGSFVADPGGDYIMPYVINIVFIETESVGLCTTGDLLYYVEWDGDGMPLKMVLAVVQSINEDGVYLYVCNGTITTGMELIKVGGVAANNSIQFNGIDANGDYIETLTDISSYRDLFNNYYYQDDGYEQFPVFDYKVDSTKVRALLGNLSRIVNTDLDLNNSSQVGFYSDNAYIEGKFVSNKGIYNNIATVVTPNYNNFIMLNTSNMFEQIDMTTKFTYWNNKADKTITILPSGPGLLGGGDLSANRTFSLDFTYLDTKYDKVFSNLITETPTGSIDGVNIVFTINNSISFNSEMLFLRGLLQKATTDYSIVNNNIVFTIPPITGDTLAISYLISEGSNYISEIPIGIINGTNTTFTTTYSIVVNTQMIFLRGLLQQGSIDYNITGSNVIFITAPISGDIVQVTYASETATDYITKEIPSGLIDGSNKIYTLANTPAIDTQSVYLRGLLQIPIIDYTIFESVITFVLAPLVGDSIAITYIKN